MAELKCKRCTERYPGCHSYCDYYIQWREKHVAKQTKIRQKKFDENVRVTAVRRDNNGHHIITEKEI